MFHHHPLKMANLRMGLTACALSIGAGCASESLSDMDGALKTVVLERIHHRRPPEAPQELVHCVAFLDTARNPPPPRELKAGVLDAEFDMLCRQAMKEGRVKDPEPWLIPSLRREFFLDPPDIRPFSQCTEGTTLTAAEHERSYVLLVERLERPEPNLIHITLQLRAPCGEGSQPEGSWGQRMSCFLKHQEGRWIYTGCSIDITS